MISAIDALGLIGVLFMIYCYGRGQWQRDYSKTLSYSIFNLVGALFLIASLFYSFNLPAFVSSSAWVIFSSYGIYRCLKYMRKSSSLKLAASSSNQL